MYFTILFLCIFLIISFNLLLSFTWQTVLNLLMSFVVVLIPSLFCAIIIRKLPKHWFNAENRIYYVSDFERKLLNFIGIKKWKDKIPELGQTVNFKKDKLIDPKNPSYIEKFLNETCYGEVLHIFCAISALTFMFFVPSGMFLTMGLPIALVYSIYNLPSILIQRYNRPRLLKQLERIKRTSERENNIEETEYDYNSCM